MKFLEKRASLAEHWLGVFRELGQPKAILACSYTFEAAYFDELIGQFREAALERGSSERNWFITLPIDVVCDRTRYFGHRSGFKVTFWPDSRRLFHPKVLIVLFEDEVVWSDVNVDQVNAAEAFFWFGCHQAIQCVMYAEGNVDPLQMLGEAKARLPHAGGTFIDQVTQRTHRLWRKRDVRSGGGIDPVVFVDRSVHGCSIRF